MNGRPCSSFITAATKIYRQLPHYSIEKAMLPTVGQIEIYHALSVSSPRQSRREEYVLIAILEISESSSSR